MSLNPYLGASPCTWLWPVSHSGFSVLLSPAVPSTHKQENSSQLVRQSFHFQSLVVPLCVQSTQVFCFRTKTQFWRGTGEQSSRCWPGKISQGTSCCLWHPHLRNCHDGGSLFLGPHSAVKLPLELAQRMLWCWGSSSGLLVL